MLDVRLKIFYSTATLGSFTKAASQLFISQPAVTQNIKELESQLGVRLFNRQKGHIELTKEGELLLEYAKNVKNLYKQFEFDLNELKNKVAGSLYLGASTTIGQYILPGILAGYHKRFPDIRLSLANGNTEQIEQLLLQGKIELGVVEGKKQNTQLKYIPFLQDELVAIAHSKQPLAKKDTISIHDLASIPVVCRERGSGSMEVLTDALNKNGFATANLKIAMHLGSTESIKAFLTNYNCLGFVSIAAVRSEIAEGTFKIIDIEGLEILREFYFVHTHGVPSGWVENFLHFALKPISKTKK